MLRASHRPARSSLVSVQTLTCVLILVVCAGAELLGCSGKSGSSEETSSSELAETDEGAEGPPYGVRLQRLGASDGGAWTAPIKGGRILMWLSKNYVEDYDAYLAVLRTGEHPLPFGIFELHVEPEGDVAMGLAPVGRDEDGSIRVLDVSPRIHLFAATQGDVIRIEDSLGDKEGLFPSGTELRRCSKREEEEVRMTLHESIR